MAKKKPTKKKTKPKAEYLDRPLTDGEQIAQAIDTTLYAEKLFGRNRTEGNLAEVIGDLANNAGEIARAINLGEGQDDVGGYSRCLSSSVMGVTKALKMIAEAISELADAVRKSKKG